MGLFGVLSVFGRRIKGMIRLRPEQAWTCNVTLHFHRPDHDQQHCYLHTPKVKPEAATAVVELLMMDVRTPETC
jgi:hypothetical protein